MMYVFVIKFLREERNISVNRLCKMSHVSRPYIMNLEANRKFNPSLKTLCKIADALEVDVKDLFYTNLELDSLKEELDARVEMFGLRSREVMEVSRVIDLLINLEIKERFEAERAKIEASP